jgi:hypothetical protein
MKVCLGVFAVLCGSALVMHGHQVKREARTYPTPTCYVKAGKSLELKEYERVYYISGLMDGFYASECLAREMKQLADSIHARRTWTSTK